MREYLEGSKVEQGKAVEEAQALKCHLDHSRAVRLLERCHATRLGLRHGVVQEDTIQHVQHANKVSVLQQCCQPSRVLPFIVEDTGGARKGDEEGGERVLRGALWALKGKYVADACSHTHTQIQDKQTATFIY